MILLTQDLKEFGNMKLITMSHLLLLAVALLSLISHGSSDLAADRAECSDKLIGLAPCLSFVGGEAKSPTPDCCTGYKEVTAKSIKCLCILVKDRDDPSLGLKIDVDSAITLPAKCDAPTNVSTCTKLLNLPLDSKDAKDFQRFESMIEGKGSKDNVEVNSREAGAMKGHPSSDARRERFMSVEMLGGMWTCFASADFASDQSECTDQLLGIATCLTYVEGQAKAPTPDCCNGLKQVVGKSTKCLCVLIKDRNEPELGITMNVTLALSLPTVCHVPAANVSNCPKVLGLPASSKEAQIFKQTASEAQGTTAATDADRGPTNTHGSGCARSDCFLGRKMSWFGLMQRVGGLWISYLLVVVALLHAHL